MTQSNAQFTIDLTPGEPLHAGTGRFDFTKTWTGDLIGTSAGTMLSTVSSLLAKILNRPRTCRLLL